MKAMMSQLLAPKPNPIIDPKMSIGGSPSKANPFPLLDFNPEKAKPLEEDKLGDTGTPSSKGKEGPSGNGHLGVTMQCHHKVVIPQISNPYATYSLARLTTLT
jgi:hypothetical protein